MTINEFESAGIVPWLEIQGGQISLMFVERWHGAMAAGRDLTTKLYADESGRVALRNECVREGRISPRKRYPAPYSK